MNLKSKILLELRNSYGDFKTNLEGEYERVIVNKLCEGYTSKQLSDNQIMVKRAWLTYNQVIVELKHNLKDMVSVKELQYRLTDYEDPNYVCIDVINGLNKLSPELKRLSEKISNF